MSAQQRVRWTEPETEAVAHALARLMVERPSTHPRRLIDRAVQQALPKHRRRTEAQVAASGRTWRRLKARAAWIAKRSAHELEPVLTHQRLLADTPTPLLVAELQRRGVELDTPTPTQVEQAWHKVASRRTALPAPKSPPPPRPRPIRIGVLGALPRQFNRLATATRNSGAELVPLERDRSLNGSLAGLDHVVSLRFITHSRIKELHGALGSRRIHCLTRGGTTKLREIIANITEQEARRDHEAI